MTSSMLDNMKGCFCFVAGSEWQKSVGGRLLHDDMRWKPRHCLQHQRSPLRVGSGTPIYLWDEAVGFSLEFETVWWRVVS